MCIMCINDCSLTSLKQILNFTQQKSVEHINMSCKVTFGFKYIKEKSEKKIIPYVSTHNPKDPEMFRVILDKVPILKEDDKMRNILSKYKLIKSERQPYSLKRLLTKANLKSNNSLKVTKCNRLNCSLCIHLLEGHSFTFKCGKNFNNHENVSCDVKM